VRAIRVLALLFVLAVWGSAGTYTVRWGDTLGGIAAKAGTTVPALLWINHLHDADHIRAGQVLNVPDPKRAGSTIAVYRVARGDTLGGIAARHGTSVAALVKLNRLRSADVVREGQILELASAPAPSAPTWVCPVPVPVRVVSPFGAPRGGGTRHEGVDLAAAEGTPIVANVSGTFSRHPNPKGGNGYLLRGDDGHTYYGAHLERYLAGDGRVALGQPIGRMGETGDAAGTLPHLHFEWWPNGGKPVDPQPLLIRACQEKSA